MQEKGALESDVFLLFSNKYALEGDSVDQEQGMPPTLPALHGQMSKPFTVLLGVPLRCPKLL